MSDTLTPERLAKLRAWRIAVGKAASFLRFQSAYGDHSHIVKQEYSEVAATLAEVDALLAAEAERDAALAEVARLKETNQRLNRRCQHAESERSAIASCGNPSGAYWMLRQAWKKRLRSFRVWRAAVKTSNQRITALEAENTKLRRWLDAAEAKLERLEKTP